MDTTGIQLVLEIWQQMSGNPQDPTGTADDDKLYDTGQIAVAVHYDTETGKTPRIVASGRGALAEQILQLAFANGVKVREDADLAEILSVVDVDTEIPLEAFAAVAEILAYVYRANGTTLPEIQDEVETP